MIIPCKKTGRMQKLIRTEDWNKYILLMFHGACWTLPIDAPTKQSSSVLHTVLRCSTLHASYLLPTDGPSAPRTCYFVSSQEHWSREDWMLVLLDRENHSAQQVYLWYLCQRCLVCVCVLFLVCLKPSLKVFRKVLVWKCLKEFSKRADTLWCFVPQREPQRQAALQKEKDVPFFCHSITLLSS